MEPRRGHPVLGNGGAILLRTDGAAAGKPTAAGWLATPRGCGTERWWDEFHLIGDASAGESVRPRSAH
jgi:hypothetical protein